MDRRIISHHVTTIKLEDCNLDELLIKLNECKSQHPTETLVITYDGEYMEYNGPSQMDISYESKETDEEYERRLAWDKEKLEEKERKELSRLMSYKTMNPANQKRLEELMEKYNEKNNI